MSDYLDKAIDEAKKRFKDFAISVQDAKGADELAAEIVGDIAYLRGFPSESDDYESLMSAVMGMAGKAFPGAYGESDEIILDDDDREENERMTEDFEGEDA